MKYGKDEGIDRTRFPRLYKLTSTGKIQEWEIWVEGNVIHKRHGLQDGKKQHTTDTIKEGKNIGRSNETTPNGQAELEAKALWTKKREKDYRETIEELNKEVKTSSFGGFLPMLAQKYTKHKNKLKWACYCQPKLDGIRCIARKENDVVSLWFRSGKQVKTMSHIEKALDRIMRNGEIFDGELYIHNADFNKLGGSIRRDVNMDIALAQKVEYHIYDFPRISYCNGAFLKEDAPYMKRLGIFIKRTLLKPLVAVRTDVINNEEEMLERFADYIDKGYEGIMIRNMESPYEQKRSYNLLKYKEFDEAEYKIVGYEEGRGQLAGTVGSFICEFPDGRQFKAKLKGDNVTDLLRHYFENPKLFMGKYLTVQYQGMSQDNIPRFPVGKIIRFDK
jgi:ATP-dependent DNA ligase